MAGLRLTTAQRGKISGAPYERNEMSIVTIIIIVILVLLAIYLAQRVL